MKKELGKPIEDVEEQDQVIFVPPMLPKILKAYAKAAIKTQPYDLLSWSASYFRALTEGKKPPAKAYIEYPMIQTKGGLTSGFLKLIIDQFSADEAEVKKDLLKATWSGIGLESNEMKQIMCTAGIYNQDYFPLYKFVSVAAGFLSRNMKQTMIMLCRLYSNEPEGGSAAIQADFFIELYLFLASIDASKPVKYIDGLPEGQHSKISQSNSVDKSSTRSLISKTPSIESNTSARNGVNDNNNNSKQSKNGTVQSPESSKNGVGGSKISVKEMESVMEQLQKTQEEKMREMEEAFESLDAIAENTKIINKNIELIRKDSTISKTSTKSGSKSEKGSMKSKTSSTESNIDPNAKGVINPVIKGIFDNVAEKIGVINTWQTEVQERQSEVIMVPMIPGIGPLVDNETMDGFLQYIKECSFEQNYTFMPRDILFSICPPLDKN